jgi:hypothetical protein
MIIDGKASETIVHVPRFLEANASSGYNINSTGCSPFPGGVVVIVNYRALSLPMTQFRSAEVAWKAPC